MKKSRNLRDLLESLPQEIYDMIYNETFTIASPEHPEIYINKSWRPPSFLQVNQASRTKCVHTYYSSHTFVARRRDTFWFDFICAWIDNRKHLWNNAPTGFGISVRLGDIGPYKIMGDGKIFS